MATTLKPRFYGAKDIFRSAISFNFTCEFLLRVKPHEEPHVAAFIGNPFIALSALTLELSLKTLHAIQSENPVPKTHDLGTLFRGLEGKYKRGVQRRWKPIYDEWHERWDHARAISYGRKMPPHSPLVADALDEASKTFEKARYTFEEESQEVNYYVDHLRKPLLGFIVETRPDFAAWRVTTPPKISWEDAAKAAADLAKKTP